MVGIVIDDGLIEFYIDRVAVDVVDANDGTRNFSPSHIHHGCVIPLARAHCEAIDEIVGVEVGIDIPNATLMIIESAERFGLNQLHQLRGRVGRGSKESECIFHITKKKSISTISEDGRKRLEAIVDLDDGFKLSEIDLEIRGEGKVTGTSQSGKSDLKVANLRYDYDLLIESKKIFESINDQKSFSEILKEAEMFFPNYFKIESST